MKDIQKFERMLKALANRRRLAILRYLRETKEASVNDIADEIHLSFKATSRHLHILAHADILIRDQRSRYVFYGFSPELHKLVKHVSSLL